MRGKGRRACVGCGVCIDCVAGVDSLSVRFHYPGGTKACEASVTVVERHVELDLALLHVDEPLREPVAAAVAVMCTPREPWRSQCRPRLSMPQLVGDVQVPSLLFMNGRGGVVEAVQLGSLLGLDTYIGYSGGPVERHLPEGAAAEVAGLIVAESLRTPGADAADVLFAIRIGFALSSLDRYSAQSLLGRLGSETDSANSPTSVPVRHLGLLAAFAARWSVWPPLLRVRRLRGRSGGAGDE